MAIAVARVHLAVAHSALPALLRTPPKCNMLPLLPTPPCPCLAAAAILLPPKPSRADSGERWDARKTTTKPAAASTGSSASSTSFPRSRSTSSAADCVRSSSARRSRGSPRKSATSPPPKPGPADSAERWDAHKKKASIPTSSSSSSPPGMSSLACTISSSGRAKSSERWDVHKKRCSCLPQGELLGDDGQSSSTGSNDIDMEEEEEEEEIVWKPRAMYAGPAFVVAAPEPGQHASDPNSSVPGSRRIVLQQFTRYIEYRSTGSGIRPLVGFFSYRSRTGDCSFR